MRVPCGRLQVWQKVRKSEENDCFSGANLLNIVKMGGLPLNKLNKAFFLVFIPF